MACYSQREERNKQLKQAGMKGFSGKLYDNIIPNKEKKKPFNISGDMPWGRGPLCQNSFGQRYLQKYLLPENLKLFNGFYLTAM